MQRWKQVVPPRRTGTASQREVPRQGGTERQTHARGEKKRDPERQTRASTKRGVAEKRRKRRNYQRETTETRRVRCNPGSRRRRDPNSRDAESETKTEGKDAERKTKEEEKHEREGSVTPHKAAGAGGVRGNRVTLEQHRLSGRQFEQIWGDNEGRGSLACCSPWGRKESDTTEGLNNNWDALAGSDRAGRLPQVGQRQGPYRGRAQVPALPAVGREVVQNEVTQGAVEVLACGEEDSVRPWPRLPGLQTPDSDHMPSAHLRKQPAAPVGTGRPRLPRYGQRRRGPRH